MAEIKDPHWLRDPEVEQFTTDLLAALERDKYLPEGGFQAEDYPEVTVDLIPFTSSLGGRPDPNIVIRSDGWMYIETGNVRLAIPGRAEWNKLVNMGTRMWNSHEKAQEKPDELP